MATYIARYIVITPPHGGIVGTGVCEVLNSSFDLTDSDKAYAAYIAAAEAIASHRHMASSNIIVTSLVEAG